MAAMNIGGDAPPPLAFGASVLPTGEVGLPYSASLVSGGVPSYTMMLSSGFLPAGLATSGDGALAGTPTAAGSFPFTLQATDQAAQEASQAFSLNVLRGVYISTTSLPAATFGLPYKATLVGRAGLQPYRWARVRGALPTGLKLSPSTGVISGTPTQRVRASLTFSITDALGATRRKSLTLTVN